VFSAEAAFLFNSLAILASFGVKRRSASVLGYSANRISRERAAHTTERLGAYFGANIATIIAGVTLRKVDNNCLNGDGNAKKASAVTLMMLQLQEAGRPPDDCSQRLGLSALLII